MGIFSDECKALIDKNTGKALSGEALEQARRDPAWPRCGHQVSKRAHFCSFCGSPAPDGWWKCPSCNKWIGNDSYFCPHCNTPLYPEDRVAMAGGVWRKEPEYYAQRFEVGDIKRELVQKLQVQEGTAAILMDSGAVSDVLSAGAHDIDSLLRQVNWFGNPPPRSVVLIDVGEVVVPLHIEALRTAEHFPIEFYGEVILRFKGGKDAARAFMSNVLKSERVCTFSDIATRLGPVIRGPVDEMCTMSSLDDLVRDPERRIRLQERMTTRIKEDLAACGLEVVRVSSAEFTGDEYEAYEQKLGEVDVQRREAEYRAVLRRLSDKEEMAEYKDADALRTYMETVDHEYRVSHATRDREFDLLKRDWAHDDMIYRRLLEVEQKEHEIRLDELEIKRRAKLAEAERLELIGDAKAAAEARLVAARADDEITRFSLETRRRKDEINALRKKDDAERRQGMSIEELLSDIEDPQQRDQLLKLYQMKLQSGMTPQQILATQGKDHYGQDYDQFAQKMAALYKDNADRGERELNRMLAALHVSISGSVSQGVNYSASSTQSSNNTNQNRTDVSSHHSSWQDMNLPQQS